MNFKTILLLLSGLILLIMLSSCAEKFELTVTSSDGGSVTMEPAGGSYKEGETVILTASPASGYSFTGWGNIADYSVSSAISREIEIIMPAGSLNVSAGFTVPGEGWTFMIYMAGDNNLSTYVSKDINEIEQGLYDSVIAGNSSLAGDVKVLILADRYGPANSALYLAAPDSNPLTIASSVIIDGAYSDTSEFNMADPGTLKAFIEYGLARYPSRYNAFVIWNHGGGVRSLEEPSELSKAICEDGSDLMNMNEVQSGISAAVGTSALDIIGLDACIMGEVETAYEMRELSDYFVASMAEEWGNGWGYEYIFDKFTAAGSPPAPSAMADILVSQFYESTNGENVVFPNTMTAVSTAALGNLKFEIDKLAGEIYNFGVGSTAQDEFEAVRDATVFYYEPRPNGTAVSDNDEYEAYILNFPYYDLYDFCMNIKSSSVFGSTAVSVQADAVLTALDAAVTAAYGNSSYVDSYYASSRDPLSLDYYETSDAAAVRGLSILIPHGEMTWPSGGTEYSHYAYDWWYTTEVLTQYSPQEGGIDFCTYDGDGTVETWRELFEAWYDGAGNTSGTY